jgi:hypothetical protein
MAVMALIIKSPSCLHMWGLLTALNGNADHLTLKRPRELLRDRRGAVLLFWRLFHRLAAGRLLIKVGYQARSPGLMIASGRLYAVTDLAKNHFITLLFAFCAGGRHHHLTGGSQSYADGARRRCCRPADVHASAWLSSAPPCPALRGLPDTVSQLGIEQLATMPAAGGQTHYRAKGKAATVQDAPPPRAVAAALKPIARCFAAARLPKRLMAPGTHGRRQRHKTSDPLSPTWLLGWWRFFFHGGESINQLSSSIFLARHVCRTVGVGRALSFWGGALEH